MPSLHICPHCNKVKPLMFALLINYSFIHFTDTNVHVHEKSPIMTSIMSNVHFLTNTVQIHRLLFLNNLYALQVTSLFSYFTEQSGKVTLIALNSHCSFTNIPYLPSNQPSSITLANQSSQTSFGVNLPQPDKYGKITKGHNSETQVSHRFALPLPLGSAFPLAGPLPLPFVSPLAAVVVLADAVVFDAAFFCKMRK